MVARSGALLAAVLAAGYGSGIHAMTIPFSTTCALLALAPEAPFSRPRAIVLSHAVCIAAGVVSAALPFPPLAASLTAAWASILLMAAVRGTHAPAVAHAAILASGAPDPGAYSIWASGLALGFALYAGVFAVARPRRPDEGAARTHPGNAEDRM